MQKIDFEERAVAFIDVLGFEPLVDSSHNDSGDLDKLQDLVNLLGSAIHILNSSVDTTVPTHLIPKHIYISDCIILSAPLIASKMEDYNGLKIIVMRAIQLTHMFLKAGYLLRGGISVGKIWHANENIVGSAYQEAVKIEKEAIVPHIKLSESAKQYWNKFVGNGNRMCIEYRGSLMVNGLYDFYIHDKGHGATERAYNDYDRTINSNLKSDKSDYVRYKWWWFKEYFEHEKKSVSFL